MSDTAEIIQARLLSNIDPTYDKTEGGFIYDVEKPLSIELETAYKEQNLIINRGFADTAIGTDLERIVADYGITRKLATYATTTVNIAGAVGSLINMGDKVASDNINFEFTEDKVIDSTGITIVNVQCEIAGAIGNMPIGAIKYFPVTLAGIVSVTNNSAITNGYESETDDELRNRYYTKVRTPATSGNKSAYLTWAKGVIGVGDAKVYPLWNGNGTVKVVIINSNKRAADAELISYVAEYIEEVRPIGALITVISAIEKAINVTVTLIIDEDNYILENIITSIESTLTEYFKTIAFTGSYVSYAKIGNAIFDVDGVLDYSNLLINNGIVNIAIGSEEIAVLGGVING